MLIRLGREAIVCVSDAEFEAVTGYSIAFRELLVRDSVSLADTIQMLGRARSVIDRALEACLTGSTEADAVLDATKELLADLYVGIASSSTDWPAERTDTAVTNKLPDAADTLGDNVLEASTLNSVELLTVASSDTYS